MHLGLWLQNKLSTNVDFSYICQICIVILAYLTGCLSEKFFSEAEIFIMKEL